MNSTTLQALLKALEAMIGPEIVQLWGSSLKPALAAEVAKWNIDAQIAGNALISALDAIITVEAPKL
jgi:hypothetical protein